MPSTRKTCSITPNGCAENVGQATDDSSGHTISSRPWSLVVSIEFRAESDAVRFEIRLLVLRARLLGSRPRLAKRGVLEATNPDRNRFAGGHLRALGVVPQREQRVAFRVVRAAAAGRNVVHHHSKTIDSAVHAVVNSGCDTDHIPVRKSQALDVARIHEQDPTSALHAAVPVVVAV